MKLIRILVAFLLLAGIGICAPYLVCDPYPAGARQPDKFVIAFDNGTPFDVVPQVNADGGKQLHYDLSTLPAGDHTVTVKAVDLWGESAPAPFAFPKPSGSLPAPGIRIDLK